MNRAIVPCIALILWMANGAIAEESPPRFVDATAEHGLDPVWITGTARLCTADLNDDGWPDAIIDRHLVFLNVAADDADGGRRFELLDPATTGLQEPVTGTVVVFADLDNDGTLDAITTEFVDLLNDNWTDHGRRTRWQRGNGDGTFGEAELIDAAPPVTTCAIAVGDASEDGRLDLYLGNWYRQYGERYEGYVNDLLLQSDEVPSVAFVRHHRQIDDVVSDVDDEHSEGEQIDNGGRPTYGVMIVQLFPDKKGASMQLLDLNYGRRWNRCTMDNPMVHSDERGGLPRWVDLAVMFGLHGDAIMHGEYPDWAVQRMAQRDPPINLEPEKPFRANGNTFDCAVGDIDNDGDFDVFLAEVTHGWAGESSDRSRFLINRGMDQDPVFASDPRLSVDRIPEGENNWNQGDLFCELADLNHDTRLDLILSSGDYPDNQRLRIYLQQADGTFKDCTDALGIDHDGSQQISLADVDHDGDLDIFAGQTFFRYSAKQKAGRTPQVRLWRNECTQGRKSLVLKLRGDGVRVNRDALGAQVFVRLADGTHMMRELISIGGHAGKQHEFIVHIGLGEHDAADSLTVMWHGDATTSRFENVGAGRYELEAGGDLIPVQAESAP
jgi:hypothetical protein